MPSQTPAIYWRPTRRTRPCIALTRRGEPCARPESIRTTAITINGQPASLCDQHWTGYLTRSERAPRLISEADPAARP